MKEKVCVYRTVQMADGKIVHELRNEKNGNLLTTMDSQEVTKFMTNYN